MEKDIEATGGSPSGSSSDLSQGKIEFPRAPTAYGRFIDSFKRNPNARVTTEAIDADGRPLPDQPPAEPALAMKLKQRHLQMIAIGGSIGSFSPKPKNLISANMLQEPVCSSALDPPLQPEVLHH